MTPPQVTRPTAKPAPTPSAAPSLSQIGVDLELLSAARDQSRYAELVASTKVAVRPRRDTAFAGRSVESWTVNSRESTYLTASSGNTIGDTIDL